MTLFLCPACGTRGIRRRVCPRCLWDNRFVMLGIAAIGAADFPVRSVGDGPLRFSEIDSAPMDRWSTGLPAVDALLGGGIVPGSALLIGGAPGLGKSTLAMQMILGIWERAPARLYIAGEETPQQIKTALIGRLGGDTRWFGGCRFMEGQSVSALVSWFQDFDVAVIDSLNVMRVEGLGGVPGGPLQVREACRLLRDAARERGITLILLSHATKAGEVFGPQFLQHIVDVVIVVRKGQDENHRTLRLDKNRFGQGFISATLDFGEKGFTG